MKNIGLLFFVLLSFYSSFAQKVFPDFLQGTWKMEGKDVYEHWDKLNDYSMKGVSYVIENGNVTVFEYLDLFYENGKVNYTATVVGENKGKGISFIMMRSDSIFIFENRQHDFPKIITYQKVSDSEMVVKISDGADKELSWIMKKVNKS